MLHTMNRGHKEFVRETVERLAKLPSYLPLGDMSKPHQLAYWLNLRNAAVMNEILELYPVTLLKKYVSGENAFIHKPVVNVLGIDLSIRDIELYISDNFKSPLVFYGFAYGMIGSPNFRSNAYRGETVWENLEANAIEFINSLRGVRDVKGSTARVSTLYGWHQQLFDLESDAFIRHITEYTEGEWVYKLAPVIRAKANFTDYHIADIINGKTNIQISPKQTLDGNGPRFVETQQFPDHARELIRQIDLKNRRRAREGNGAKVTIEEYVKQPKVDLKEEDGEDEIVVAPKPKAKKKDNMAKDKDKKDDTEKDGAAVT